MALPGLALCLSVLLGDKRVAPRVRNSWQKQEFLSRWSDRDCSLLPVDLPSFYPHMCPSHGEFQHFGLSGFFTP